MNDILKFRRDDPVSEPKVKPKRKPRLRVIRQQADVRLTRSELNRHVDAFMRSLSGCPYASSDDKYIWISIGASERHFPAVRFAIHRWSGSIFPVQELLVSKVPCGNVVDWA